MILPITVVWDFNPVFFSIGSFDIRYYGLMWVLAILGGMLFFDQVCKREGLPEGFGVDFRLWHIGHDPRCPSGTLFFL
jgi:prolipoprotein diacylglyceryltransferase